MILCNQIKTKEDKQMFRISYLDQKNNLAHKSFESIAAAYKWVEENTDITPLRLLIWDDSIDCFSTYKKF